MKTINQKDYYGNQYIFDENDQIIDEEVYLLLNALDLTLNQIIAKIHQFQRNSCFSSCFPKKYGVYVIVSRYTRIFGL